MPCHVTRARSRAAAVVLLAAAGAVVVPVALAGLSGLGGVCLPCLPQGRQELVSFEDPKYPCYVMKLSKLIEIGDEFVGQKWAHEMLLGRVGGHADKYDLLPPEMDYG